MQDSMLKKLISDPVELEKWLYGKKKNKQKAVEELADAEEVFGSVEEDFAAHDTMSSREEELLAEFGRAQAADDIAMPETKAEESKIKQSN